MLRFTKDHEWVRVEGNNAVVGISTYAQETLGDIVYAELPKTDKSLARGDVAVVLESRKTATEIYSPISGDVVNVNMVLDGQPGLINSDPMGEGWIFVVTLSDVAELDDMMDEDAYTRYVEGLE